VGDVLLFCRQCEAGSGAREWAWSLAHAFARCRIAVDRAVDRTRGAVHVSPAVGLLDKEERGYYTPWIRQYDSGKDDERSEYVRHGAQRAGGWCEVGAHGRTEWIRESRPER